MELYCEKIRDWVHENYQAAYCLGTGALTLAAWALCPQKYRKTSAFLGAYSAIKLLSLLMTALTL